MSKQTQNLIILLFLSSFCFTSCSEKELTPLDLASELLNNYEQKKSLSYEIDYQIKYFSEPTDTNKMSAKIDLIREKSDSLYGGHLWIEVDSIIHYYNTENYFRIFHNSKKIIKYPEDKSHYLSGRAINQAQRIYFLNPTRLLEGSTDSTIVAKLSDDHIDGKEVWKFTYDILPNVDIQKSWKNIWIDKADFTIPKMNYFALSEGEEQYNQWDLKNIAYDLVTKKDLEDRITKLSKEYEISDYKVNPSYELEPLSEGTVLPNIAAITYPNNKDTDLNAFHNKLTLYDFWYMDCPPCRKAIPHLNELHNKYSDKGLTVVGVNPYDNNEKDLKRFPNFLSFNKIDYPIVFTDFKETKVMQVLGYPTFYLVDDKGIVLHSEAGFDEASAAEFVVQIEEYLSK